MSFVYPEFLYALSALAIPVIVHLFNFRRYKRIEFSNVRFLKDVKQESRSRSRLRNLLILLMRMLALALLVFAFAQPYLPAGGEVQEGGDKAVAVYIDNSFSMEGRNQDGRLLELAKQKAIDIAEAHRSTDRLMLVTNTQKASDKRMLTRDEFIGNVEEIESSPVTRKLSSILSRTRDMLARTQASNRVAYVISDLQKTVTDIDAMRSDSTVSRYFLPVLPEERSNLYVDSVWFETPVRQVDQQEKLNLRIVNDHDEAVSDVPMELHIDGEKKALASFDVPAATYTDTSVFFTNRGTGIRKGKVSIQDHPVNFDDQYFFSYEVADSISVLRLSKGLKEDTLRDRFAAIFEDDPFYAYRSVAADRIDYARLKESQLIVLDGLSELSSGLAQELQKFLKGGGSVLVFPGDPVELDGYNNFLKSVGADPLSGKDTGKRSVQEIDLDAPLYRNVFERTPENMDLPVTQAHYTFNEQVRSGGRDLMTLQGGASFLKRYEAGKGKLYVAAVPGDGSFSNLPEHALFVTTVLRIGEFSSTSGQMAYTIGQDPVIEVEGLRLTGEDVFHIVHPEREMNVIPEHRNFQGGTRIFTRGQISEAGHYDLRYNEEVIRGLGFNYSRLESDLTGYSPDAFRTAVEDNGLARTRLLETELGEVGRSIRRIEQGIPLWRYCIILALLFIAMEVLLLAGPGIMKGLRKGAMGDG